MSTVCCDVCVRQIPVSIEDRKYLDATGPFVCSLPCIVQWINQQDGPGPIKYFSCTSTGEGFNGGPDTVYSDILQQGFRSEYERHFAEKMHELELKFLYEPMAFAFRGKTYIPDFYFPFTGAFVEIKGPWYPSAKSKMRAFRLEYPDIPLLVVPWILAQEFYDA